MEKRPNWTQTALELAKVIASRAACTRSQVGAVVISENRQQVFLGYNGVPPGELHCTDGGCPRGFLTFDDCPPLSSYENCNAIHAERNALMRAGTAAQGGLLCITRSPCADCLALAKEYGIKEIIHL